MPRCLRQRAHGADQGHLRGSDAGRCWQRCWTDLPAATARSPARRSAGRRRARRRANRPLNDLAKDRTVGSVSVVALQDKDRIFPTSTASTTGGWRARRRAAPGTAPRHPDRERPRLHHRPDQDLGPARPRRGGLSDRPEVVLHAQGGERRPHYLVVNADESEPGACKDREIMRNDPHLLIEGCLIASLRHAGAHLLHLHPRRVRARARAAGGGDRAGLRGQADRQGQRPRLGLRLRVHHGGGAYICGDETALMESLEGKKGQPRLKPPFPAGAGLYGCPTTVNNVEIHRGRAATSCAAAPTGSPASASPRTPAPSCSADLGPRRTSPASSRRRWASACAADRGPLRRRARRLGQPEGRDPRRLVGAADPGRAVRGPDDRLRRPVKLRSGLGTGGRDRHGQVDRPRRRHRAASPTSTSTRAAASARPAARAPAGCGG